MQHTGLAEFGAGYGRAISIRQLAVRAWRAANAWNERRRVVHQMATLSDHDLKDLGIHRSEIASVVYGGRPERLRGYPRGE